MYPIAFVPDAVQREEELELHSSLPRVQGRAALLFAASMAELEPRDQSSHSFRQTSLEDWLHAWLPIQSTLGMEEQQLERNYGDDVTEERKCKCDAATSPI